MEIRRISVSQLLVDVENPRLDSPQPNQPESIRMLVGGQPAKIFHLAKDILDHGLNPSDAMIVMPAHEDRKKYLVLEGNRRLCALKMLEDPIHVQDLFSPSTRMLISQMSNTYRNNPVDQITCAIVANREEARHWIELRHGGEKEGAGIVRWGAAETARFRQRFGKEEIHLKILDYLEDKGALTTESRQRIPITSMRRVVEDRHTRDQLGYDLENGDLVIEGNPQKVIDVLARVASDLSSGQIRTKDIYHKGDRVAYVDNILAETEQVKFETVVETPASIVSPSASDTPSRFPAKSVVQTRQVPLENNRLKLIPKSIKLKIQNHRINEIYDELKKLDLKDFPNAVAVLFRVFLELSVDDYIYHNSADLKRKPEDPKYTLRQKLLDITDHLQAKNKLTEQHSRAVRHAAQSDNFSTTSLNVLHQYVHNPFFKPPIDDLRTAWDNFQSFIMAIWD